MEHEEFDNLPRMERRERAMERTNPKVVRYARGKWPGSLKSRYLYYTRIAERFLDSGNSDGDDKCSRVRTLLSARGYDDLAECYTNERLKALVRRLRRSGFGNGERDEDHVVGLVLVEVGLIPREAVGRIERHLSSGTAKMSDTW